ncbi:acylphosphatase [Staphylococcus sp. 17KM0847]|uniref:acylphosphatase n=1 Tax=Staphylococcus sp. 17KM0847 TaxID=2583989 RepID=UPI0015DC9D51|nr:acylphosphatase [Staphylococcus sp. 17KM0847]QLK86196.1 acylphosphatase [Staphylococcus sp. 17KM0847]
MKRCLIHVYGRVQGVGFRYFTERLAQKYKVTGTVRNVADYVEVIAQADNADLDPFVNAVIHGASPASSVTNYHIETLDIDPTLKKFTVLA